MSSRISHNALGVEEPNLDWTLLSNWIDSVAHNHGKIVGEISYLFVDDEGILKYNRDFLNHDYYTDIITFDYSTRGMIRGDIIISLDTVESNASQVDANYNDELMRVIIHGILHLCGINDKGPGERKIMEAHENEALILLNSISK